MNLTNFLWMMKFLLEPLMKTHISIPKFSISLKWTLNTKPIPVTFVASYFKQKECSETISGMSMSQTGKPEDEIQFEESSNPRFFNHVIKYSLLGNNNMVVIVANKWRRKQLNGVNAQHINVVWVVLVWKITGIKNFPLTFFKRISSDRIWE